MCRKRQWPGRSAVSACLLALLLSAPVHASPIILMDGLLVDRLEDGEAAYTNSDAVPRRSLETVFQPPRESLSLDLPAPGSVDAPYDEVQRRQRAAELYGSERLWESALREYQQLIRLRPEHLPYKERAAVVATLAGRYAEADAYFFDITEAKPNNVDYLAAWGHVLVRLLRLEQASAVLERALDLEPDHVMARHNQLLLNVARGEPVDMAYWTYRTLPQIRQVTEWLLADAADLRELLGSEQLNHIVRTTLGELSVEQLPAFNQALTHAVQCLNQQEWRCAYDQLTDAQALGATLPFLQLERLRALVEMGEAEEAVLMADSLASAHYDSPELMYGYAFILIKAGDYDRAVFVLADVAERMPDRPETRFAQACALAGAGRIDEAWPILAELAADHPQRFLVWMEGDTPYLNAIRADPRYEPLLAGQTASPR